MNDLEPWKIWAVTAVLVCAILGSTAARIRSQGLGEESAEAVSATSDERSASVTATCLNTTADQYEGYPSYIPHGSFGSTGNSGVQASTIMPLSNLLYGSNAPSVMQAEVYQEASIDVTQQIRDSQDSQSDLVGWNGELISLNSIPPPSDNVEDQTTDFDLVTSRWIYPATRDKLAFDMTYNPASADGNSVVFVDPSGTVDARVLDLALRSAVINVAIHGSDSNGAVNLLQAFGSGYGNAAEQPDEIYSQAVSPAQYQPLALSGELQEELADEQEVLDEARTQALRAEAQLQAAQQLRDETVYTSTLGGRVNMRISDVQFAVNPEE